jgi:hypothetical protein
MITAFDIYLVLQLDSITRIFSIAAIASGISSLILGMIGFCEGRPNMIKAAKKCIAVAMLSAVPVAFIPSSKTAAAMIVIPAIVNNEKFQGEAKELYDLAKRALSDEVTEPKGKGEKPE